MKKLMVAKSAGFCFGVSRSVKMAEEMLAAEQNCYSLGELIHNDDVVQHLRSEGLTVVDGPEQIPQGASVIIRSHGVSRAEFEAVQHTGATVYDATCPKVKRIHEIVAEASAEGRQPVIIGAAGHPEVRAICGWCVSPVVVNDAAELAARIADGTIDCAKPLTGLRALRKCIELSWVHTGRNHEVAGTLWSTTDEDRSLNLHEVLAVEEVTDEDAHTVAQLQVLAYGRATQVEVTILHTDIITTISIIFDSERRSLALREHVEFLHQDFDITGIHLRILALSLAYCTLDLDAVFTTQLVSCIAQVLVIGLIEDQLCDTITVAQVNECHTTHLS